MRQMRGKSPGWSEVMRGAARPGPGSGRAWAPVAPERRFLGLTTPGARSKPCPAPLTGQRGPGSPAFGGPSRRAGPQAGQEGAGAGKRPPVQASSPHLSAGQDWKGPKRPPCFLLSPSVQIQGPSPWVSVSLYIQDTGAVKNSQCTSWPSWGSLERQQGRRRDPCGREKEMW